MSDPASWLEQTFPTHARAETLLKPDLESGLITQHDYQLAVDFLPGFHRAYPFVYGVGATTLASGYGRFVRKPRWGSNLMFLASFSAWTCGSILGQLHRAKAHMEFTRNLNDAEAFSKALQNVNSRLGEKQPLDWTLAEAKRQLKTAVSKDSPQPEESGDGWADGGQTASQEQTPREAQQTASQSRDNSNPRSRWEEIRAASARKAQTSSWDALRQDHERAAVSDNVQSASIPFPLNGVDPERAQEQARFDALLEAERKMARG